MKSKIQNIIIKAIKSQNWKANFSQDFVSPSRHCDFTSNIAFRIAKEAKLKPIEVAKKLADYINKNSKNTFTAEAAMPGFINLNCDDKAYTSSLEEILKLKENFGKAPANGKAINVEYVSANPTGYLHVGHARNAAIGSVLSNIFKFGGWVVDQEYYINDAGNQMKLMARSIYYRYLQLEQFKMSDKVEMPKDCYGGSDVIECAKNLYNKYKDKFLAKENFAEKFEDFRPEIQEFGYQFFLSRIRDHLAQLGIKFDFYRSERSISRKTIDENIANLKHTKKHDGAIWFKSTIYGDDKDRVLIKKDGDTTYFAPDIVNHALKANRRKYTHLIDIWGADHFGYIPRMQYALQDLGYAKGFLKVIVMQMVKLVRDGENVKMSKRRGTTITMKKLMDEIGVDAMRFYLTNQDANTEIEINIDLAKSKNNKNQVYYIQYAHARAHQLLKKSALKPKVNTDYKMGKEGKALLVKLMYFPALIIDITNNDKFHLLNSYLYDLAKLFHSYYNTSKIIGDQNESTKLAIILASQVVIKTGLTLLGIKSPNVM